LDCFGPFEEPAVLQFRGTQEECECVAGALNELAREQHAKLIAAENEKRLDKLAQWDRERDERIQAVEKTLGGLADGDG